MALFRTCRHCGGSDVTVQRREGVPSNLAVSCVSCYVNERTSSTRKAEPVQREETDRYAALARKYGCY